MSRFQFLFTVLATITIVAGSLTLLNYYSVEQIPHSDPVGDNTSIVLAETTTQNIIIGKVIAVTDGDTIRVLTADESLFVIRLAGIDAPENGQDFGQKSKEFLSRQVFDRQVRINISKIDRYGRSVGQVFHSERDVNLEIINAGLAWHYKKYETEQNERDRKLYAEAETRARQKKIGIWSMPRTVPPWEFRHPEQGNQN